jgi:hypothetical protein
MTTYPEGGEVYSVTTESGREYRVDRRDGRCTCPDHKHRSARCKHLRRVAFATGERSVPAGVDGVDERLGEHTDGTAHAVATDGGSDVIDAGDEGEVLEESDGDGRPDACDCGAWNQGTGLPCWPCYRDGFDEPASGDE